MNENTNHDNSTGFEGIRLSRQYDVGITDPGNILCITSKPFFERDDFPKINKREYEEIKNIGVDKDLVLIESENNSSVLSKEYIDKVMFILGTEDIEDLIDRNVLVADDKPAHFQIEDNLYIIVATRIGDYERYNFDMAIEFGIDIDCPSCGEFCCTMMDEYRIEDVDSEVFCENENCYITSFNPSKLKSGESRDR